MCGSCRRVAAEEVDMRAFISPAIMMVKAHAHRDTGHANGLPQRAAALGTCDANRSFVLRQSSESNDDPRRARPAR